MTITQFLPIIVAPILGSFLGVLIVRIPNGRPIGWARSACDGCNRPLGAAELVPLLSYLFLRGKCRACGAAIGGFYPAIELAATTVAGLAIFLADNPGRAWAACVLGWTLLALAWIDARHFRLPDVLSLPLILAGLAATWVLTPDEILDHALATLAGYLAFRLLAWGYRTLRGHDGLGSGDAKLLAAGGAWIGISGLSTIVFVAAVTGLIWVLVLQRRGVSLTAMTKIPFGPSLCFAIWIVYLIF